MNAMHVIIEIMMKTPLRSFLKRADFLEIFLRNWKMKIVETTPSILFDT